MLVRPSIYTQDEMGVWNRRSAILGARKIAHCLEIGMK